MRASAQVALMLFRVSFGLFILVWGLNKMLNPQGTARIFETFYGWAGLGTSTSFLLGLLQVFLGLAIMAGLLKTLSYGAGAAVHGTSTLATYDHLLLPFAESSNLLFFAAVPVFLGAVGLFLARRADTLLSLDEWRSAPLRGSTQGQAVGE
jgi:putative oxidoreductase